MADDNDLEINEHGESGRLHHKPQHASAKHQRKAEDKPEPGFVIHDGTDDSAPSAGNDSSVDAGAGSSSSFGEPEDHVDMSEDTPAAAETPAAKPAAVRTGAPAMAAGTPVHHKFWHWICTHKKISIPLVILIVVGLLAAIPPTRYLLAGTVLRKNFNVLVTDSQTHKPVTSASITLEGKKATTNNKGIATIKANVGHAKLAVSKKYYTGASKSVLIPIGSQKQAEQISLTATGRQVPVVVNNKITGKPAANITVSAQGTEAKTDAKGELTLVLPAGKGAVDATLSGRGYNKAKVTVKVTSAADPANTFTVTPSGKLYFLSNATGNIDVVKTDLDGANREVVLAGTGKEDKYNTVLLASQDWQYLALQSKRDGGDNPKLYLINTSNDAVTTMDEGDVDFTITGWSGHYFVYSVNRHNVQQWQPSRQALKSYDAENSKNITIDQTAAAGNGNPYYFTESFTNVSIVKGDVVYGKNIYGVSLNDVNGHQATLNAAKADGSDKQAVKGWSFSSPFAQYYGTVNGNVDLRQYEPGGVYAAVNFAPQTANPDTNLYEYENGKVSTVSGKNSSNIYDGDYLTYLLSPSNDKSFWAEARDGKNSLFVGNADGSGGKSVAASTEYQPYGWYSQKYLLMSKGGSELYVMSAAGGTPLKITDYYRPGLSFVGYGSGYGGF
jgi:hypothetical protein